MIPQLCCCPKKLRHGSLLLLSFLCFGFPLVLPATPFPPSLHRFASRSPARCSRTAAAHKNTAAHTESTELRSARCPKNTTPGRGLWRWRGAISTSSSLTGGCLGSCLSLLARRCCTSPPLLRSATSSAPTHKAPFPHHHNESLKRQKRKKPRKLLSAWFKRRRDWPQGHQRLAAVDKD